VLDDLTDGERGEQIRVAIVRDRARRLRREAVKLADEYGKLAERHRPDHAMVADDVSAVILAWSEVSDRSARQP
jgi:hypothetical protein